MQQADRDLPAITNTENTTRYASIDVGTNSVKLVVADLANGIGKRLFEESVTTRLGEGMQAQANRLREVPMRRTLDAVVRYVGIAQEHQVRDVAAVGTAALRQAENRDEFLRRVQEACGLTIEVIPGEEEARLAYVAVRRDALFREYSGLAVLEIGGGSMQVTQGVGPAPRPLSGISLNVGAVRLTEGYLKSDPPSVSQLAAANQAAAEHLMEVSPLTSAASVQVVGVGGTMTNLAAMDRGEYAAPDELHGYQLTAEALERRITLLASQTVGERRTTPGLDPERADIILGGAILLLQALARLGCDSLRISTRGMRWGVLYDRFLTP